MVKRLSRFKPGVNRRTLLFWSAALWTVIGTLLLAKGMNRLKLVTDWREILVATAIVAGSLKSYFILDGSARRGIDRILNFKDGTCLGAIYSVKTWLLVLCMMVMGVILRDSNLPMGLLCLIYLTIGWALLLSSRLAWKAWLKTN